MRNGRIAETVMLEQGLRRIADLLPPTWDATLTVGEGMVGDVLVVLRGPAGVGVTYSIEARRAGGWSLAGTVATLRERQRESGLPVLFV
jgi:hypothetical protein